MGLLAVKVKYAIGFLRLQSRPVTMSCFSLSPHKTNGVMPTAVGSFLVSLSCTAFTGSSEERVSVLLLSV